MGRGEKKAANNVFKRQHRPTTARQTVKSHMLLHGPLYTPAEALTKEVKGLARLSTCTLPRRFARQSKADPSGDGATFPATIADIDANSSVHYSEYIRSVSIQQPCKYSSF